MRKLLSLISLIALCWCAGCGYPGASSTATSVETDIFLSGGELRFGLDKAETSETGNKPAQGCWPSTYFDDGSGFLMRSKTGKVEGRCDWKSPSEVNPQVTWNNTGYLLGKYIIETGEVTFRLGTQADYPELGTVIKNNFDAKGFMTSGSHAEGEAEFTSICQSTTVEPRCGVDSSGNPRKSWNVSGKVPWTIDFLP